MEKRSISQLQEQLNPKYLSKDLEVYRDVTKNKRTLIKFLQKAKIDGFIPKNVGAFSKKTRSELLALLNVYCIQGVPFTEESYKGPDNLSKYRKKKPKVIDDFIKKEQEEKEKKKLAKIEEKQKKRDERLKRRKKEKEERLKELEELRILRKLKDEQDVEIQEKAKIMLREQKIKDEIELEKRRAKRREIYREKKKKEREKQEEENDDTEEEDSDTQDEDNDDTQEEDNDIQDEDNDDTQEE